MLVRSARLLARQSTSSAFEIGKVEREARDLAESIAERIASNKEACTSIAFQLDESARQSLLQALIAADGSKDKDFSKSYLETLFRQHDTQAPFGQLDRSEFQAAINADRKLVAERTAASGAELPVSNLSIALASSIPFIGMGAVDNAIMLVAGSEIDSAFGAKLGLSTLAAAGLGNLVSDVAGVSMANRIEEMTQKMTWLNQRAYQAGSQSRSGKAARLTGSVAGVALGCLIGMAPLLFMDTHEGSQEETVI